MKAGAKPNAAPAVIEVDVPVRLVSPNVREHWAARARRTRIARAQAFAHLAGAIRYPECALWKMAAARGEVTVTITWRTPRPMDDDNVIAAAKAVRDGIADFLRVDDAVLEVEYKQVRSPRRMLSIMLRRGCASKGKRHGKVDSIDF